jgi:ABC-type Mn2+/Zn2+ transport system permease subunit
MARSNFKNIVREGFGVGLGFLASLMVYLFFGMLFFIPGFILYMQEKKKGEKASTIQIVGVILMALGVIIMGGLGFSTLIGEVSDMV